jgi:glycerol-3-phosphate dehydrogenase
MVYGVRHEMAMTLGDLLIRRTHVAFEMADQARSLASTATDLVAPWLQWTTRDRDAALRSYDSELNRIFGSS